MQTRQLSLDEIIPEMQVKQAMQAEQQASETTARDPSKHICHGTPMRKVNLGPGRVGYKCDECLTLVVREK